MKTGKVRSGHESGMKRCDRKRSGGTKKGKSGPRGVGAATKGYGKAMKG